jgi:hypothetical protein
MAVGINMGKWIVPNVAVEIPALWVFRVLIGERLVGRRKPPLRP